MWRGYYRPYIVWYQNLIIGNAIVSNLVITMFISYTCTVHLSIEGWRHALLNRDFLPPHVIKLGTSCSVLQPVQPTSSEDHSLPHMKVTNTFTQATPAMSPSISLYVRGIIERPGRTQ